MRLQLALRLPLGASHSHGPQAPALAQHVGPTGRWLRHRRRPCYTPTAAPSLDVLGRRSAGGLDAAPEADGDDGGEGKEDAQRDAETPDGLDFVAGRLVRVDPLVDVALGVLDVVVDRVEEVGRVALARVLVALEVADGLADEDGHDDYHDQDGGVGASGNEHGQHRVPVQDVVDGNVDGGQARLLMLASQRHKDSETLGTHHDQSPNQGRRSDIASIDSLADKVGRETNDGEQSNTLRDAHGRKGHAQGAVSGCGTHICEGHGCDERELRSRGALSRAQGEMFRVERQRRCGRRRGVNRVEVLP